MTTFNRLNNQSGALTISELSGGRQEAYVETVLDLGATGNTHAAADVFSALQVPAGYSISATGIEVLKVDSAGNSGTLLVKNGATSRGSATAPTSLGFDSANWSATAVVPSGSSANITLTIGTGAVNCVVRVFAILSDSRAKPGTPVVVGTATNPAGQTSLSSVDPAGYTLTTVL